jgi:spermidine synthase/MFS family permease
MNKKNVYFILFFISGFSGLMYESVWSHYLKLFLGHAAYAQTLVLMIYMGGLALGSYAAARLGPRIRNMLFWYAACEAGIGVLAIVFHPAFIHAIGFSYATVIPNVRIESWLHVYKWLLSALLILPQSVLLGTTFPFMSAGLLRKYPEKPGKTLAILYFTNSCGGALGVLICGYFFLGAAGYPGTIAIAGGLNSALAAMVWLLNTGENRLRPESIVQTDPGRKDKSRKLLRIFLLISALTGASSFMYEIGWIRMLVIVMGSYTHAFELMLSAFVLGLALGSLFIRRKIDIISDRSLALAIVQMAMGVFALLTIVFYNSTFDLMRAMLDSIHAAGSRFFWLQLSSQAIAYIVMLPATICAGMTLPLITFHLLKNDCGEKSIGTVYAANTLGAIVGVLAGVQLIMPVLGLKNLMIVGGAIDIAIGVYLVSHVSRRAFLGTATAALAVLAFCVFGVSFDSAKMSSQIFTEAPWDKQNKVLFHKDGKTATVDVVQYAQDGAKGICTNGMNVGTIADAPNVITQNATLLAALPLSMEKNPKDVATFGVGTGYNARVFLSDSGIKSVDIIEIEKQMYEGSRLFGDWVFGVYADPRCHRYVEDARSFFAWKNKKYDIVVADISYVWVSGVANLFSKEFYRMMRAHIAKDGLFVQWMHTTSMPLLASIMDALSASFSDYSMFYAGNFLIIVAGNNTAFERINESVFVADPGPARFLRENSIDTIWDFRFHYLGNRKSLGPLFESYHASPNSDYYPVLDLEAFKAAIQGKSDCFDKAFALRFMRLPVIDMLENRKSVGVSHYASMNVMGARAHWVHDFCAAKGDMALLEKGGIDREDSLSMSVLAAPIEWKSTITGAFDVEKATNWILAVNDVMKLCFPVLTFSEMKDIIDYVKTRAQGATVLPDIERTVVLYEAINNRDYETCFTIAMQYLSQSDNVTAHETFFLPLAMLSALKIGKPEVVGQLWGRYENKDKPETAVRLLNEMAGMGSVY